MQKSSECRWRWELRPLLPPFFKQSSWRSFSKRRSRAGSSSFPCFVCLFFFCFWVEVSCAPAGLELTTQLRMMLNIWWPGLQLSVPEWRVCTITPGLWGAKIEPSGSCTLGKHFYQLTYVLCPGVYFLHWILLVTCLWFGCYPNLRKEIPRWLPLPDSPSVLTFPVHGIGRESI